MFEQTQFLNDVKLKCAKQLEITEAKLGRAMSQMETYAFEAGYLYGHSEGQMYAKKIISNLNNVLVKYDKATEKNP